MSEKNWAGNHTYPSELVRPGSLEELSAVVAEATSAGRSVRAVGSRHSFNGIADADVMIDLGGMPEQFEISRSDSLVWVNAAMTYGRFAELARPEGIALPNLASLPHISIAGAMATGTHGSGSQNQCLATSIVGMEILDDLGEPMWVENANYLRSTRVHLGAQGIITQLAVRVVPAFEVEQRVFDGVPWHALADRFDEMFGVAYSVSAFTRWGLDPDEAENVSQLWVKRRTDQPDLSAMLRDLGAIEATENRHPIRSLDAEACTEQLGTPGLWSDRLPHFRMGFTPSAGDEIQTEYFLARSDAAPGIEAIRSIAGELSDALLVSEIRTIAADDIWMSPCFERDSVAFHFTWGPDLQKAEQASAAVLGALAPFDPRPHWGKVFPTPASSLQEQDDPGANEFLAHSTLGPSTECVKNGWLERHVGSPDRIDWDSLERPADAAAAFPAGPIGLGTFGSDHVSHDDVASAVRHGIKCGYRFFDCASVYGNEAAIGEVLCDLARTGSLNRSDVFISSKVWNDRHHDVLDACRQSIADLRLDEIEPLCLTSAEFREQHPDAPEIDPVDFRTRNPGFLDLYLVHWPFPNHHPPHCDVDERNPEAVPYDHARFMDTWRQMEDLVDRGLVKQIGTSNMTISKLDRVLEDARVPPAVNQMELHPHFQQPDLVAYLKSNGILPIGFCPLGSPARPERDRTPDDTSPMEDPLIVALATDRGVHPAEICLRWAVQNGHIPIPFSTNPRNILANLEAAVAGEPLSDTEMEAIRSVDRNNRLIKGQVFLWPEATDWTDLWN